ncbi:MAG TPA: acyl-CoA dehydrogenase family protein [Stellaceae bacterium]|nr:acyl-CoA dehydrogenase family protein [Stellaceae bacterium]
MSEVSRVDGKRSDRPLREELMAAVDAIVPVLRSNADRAERDRRLPDESIEALERAGIFRLLAPRRMGGLEVDLVTFVDVVAALSRGCGSSAWYGFIINGGNWLLSMLPDEAQRDVWKNDPRARICAILEPSAQVRSTEDGIVLNGKWAYASGCHHSKWAMLGFPVLDESGRMVDEGGALVPMSDLTIEDSWYVAGMRATGSDTLIANAVRVPSHRTMRMSSVLHDDPPSRHFDETIYRLSVPATLILLVIPPVLGLAQTALDLTLERLDRGRRISYTFYTDSRRAPTTQLQIAQAAMLIESAFLHTRFWAGEIDSAARRGEALDFMRRCQVRMNLAHAVRCCREAMGIMLNLQGAGSFAQSNALQRVWRDFEVASRHGLLNAEISQEVYGKALLGIEEQMTPIL